MSGRIQGGTKLFASVAGQKIEGGKITLYTVLHFTQ